MSKLSELILEDSKHPEPYERVAFFGRQTGLQWLTQSIFPPLLQGIVGRWLLTKLFNKLIELKLIPEKFQRWLFKPVGGITNPLEASAEIDVGSTADAIHILRANVLPEYEAILGICDGFVQASAEYSEDVVTSYAHDFMRRLAFIPDEKEIQAQVGSWSDGRIRMASVRGPYSKKDPQPKGINPECLGIWRQVLKNYEMQIKSLGSGDPLREWATAILIYQRVCSENKMAPWLAGVTPLGSAPSKDPAKRKKLCNVLNSATLKGLKLADELRDSLTLSPYNLAFRKAKKFGVFYSSSKDEFVGHVSYLATDLPKDTINTIRRLVTKRSNSIVMQSAESYRIGVELKGSELYIQVQLPLRKDQAFLLTGSRNHDNEELLAELRKVFREWSRNNLVFK